MHRVRRHDAVEDGQSAVRFLYHLQHRHGGPLRRPDVRPCRAHGPPGHEVSVHHLRHIRPDRPQQHRRRLRPDSVARYRRHHQADACELLHSADGRLRASRLAEHLRIPQQGLCRHTRPDTARAHRLRRTLVRHTPAAAGHRPAVAAALRRGARCAAAALQPPAEFADTGPRGVQHSQRIRNPRRPRAAQILARPRRGERPANPRPGVPLPVRTGADDVRGEGHGACGPLHSVHGRRYAFVQLQHAHLPFEPGRDDHQSGRGLQHQLPQPHPDSWSAFSCFCW